MRGTGLNGTGTPVSPRGYHKEQGHSWPWAKNALRRSRDFWSAQRGQIRTIKGRNALAPYGPSPCHRDRRREGDLRKNRNKDDRIETSTIPGVEFVHRNLHAMRC